MRHKQKKFSLNRFTSWRKATLVSLARSIIIQGRIKTTLTKAKAVRPLAERLVSLAKNNSLPAKRKAFAIVGDHKIVTSLFNEVAPLFKSRVGGYTRIVRLGVRRGDDAQMVILELTEMKKVAKKPKKIKESKPQEPKPPETISPEVKEKGHEEKKHKPEAATTEKPPISKKPPKNFLGGIRNIFKKERDSL